MNFAAMWVDQFALIAVRRSEPALVGRPVALITGEGRKATVTDFSAETVNLTIGLAVPLATARCPGLQLRERDPVAESEAQRILIAAAFALSPRVEATAGGCCTIDLQGADPGRTEAAMRGQVEALQQLGLPVRIGAGDTPLLARYAAQRADPILIVTVRAEFLRPLPIAMAEPTNKQREILHSWGITTFGGLTALTKGEIGARLGPTGVALWERANGDAPPVLRLTEPARSFVAEWNYDPPVEAVEPLLFKLKRFAERIVLELRGAGLVAEALALTLLLEDETDYRRDFRLPEPGADLETWLRVLQTHLETMRLAERVIGVRLVATPARPEQRQDGLFDTGLTDPNSFWENLARLAALVGDDRVGTPVALESHAPDAFRLERPAITVPAAEPAPIHPARGGLLRRFRPAVPAYVVCNATGPLSIDGQVAGEIRATKGPYILRGDWWKPGTWAVETWHVELAGGGLYQLTRTAEGWWVEGVLD